MNIALVTENRSIRKLVKELHSQLAEFEVAYFKNLNELSGILRVRKDKVRRLLVAAIDMTAGTEAANQYAISIRKTDDNPIVSFLFIVDPDDNFEEIMNIPGADEISWPFRPAAFVNRIKNLAELSRLKLELNNPDKSAKGSGRNLYPDLNSEQNHKFLRDNGSYRNFLKREWQRCLRYDRYISLLCVSLSIEEKAASGKSGASGRIDEIGNLLADCTQRPGDGVYIHTMEDFQYFLIVLSETDSGGASHVAYRILHNLTDYKNSVKRLKIATKIGICSLKPLQAYRGSGEKAMNILEQGAVRNMRHALLSPDTHVYSGED